MSSGFYSSEHFNYPKRQARNTNRLALVESRPPLYQPEMYANSGFSTYNVPYGRPGSLEALYEPRAKNAHGKMIDVKPFKNNSIGDISLTSSQRTDSTTSSRNGLSSIFVDYSDKCSMVGVPYIRNAKNLYERALWSILLLVAICVMGYHLQMLFTSYFSYSKHTQISLGFNTLDFPAITFCNVNAMRKSKMQNATEGLLAVIQAVSMDNLQKNVKKWSPGYDKQQNRPSNAPPGNMRESNFFDSMPNSNITSPRADVSDYFKQNYPDTWQGECQASTFNSLRDTFKDNWVELLPEERIEMGHQIQNMLIQCSYAGGQCVMSNFTVSQSASYGNCYTIQNSKWLARSSGPDQGFELILFLETDEYIPGITNEKGIQLVVHEQGTTAFPDDEGIAVAAGAQTVIGLRQSNISRLESPYGECASPSEFLETYGVKYTRTTCQKICQQKTIIETCKCFDERALQANAIMNYSGGYPACKNKTQMYCLTAVQWNFTTDNDKCACNSPCKEIQFVKTVSSRQWPSDDFANVMVDMICQEHPGSTCNNIRDNKSSTGTKEEFVRLNIYFEDLNYEKYEEAADYELTQFLSDVGGTIGLYIGLSVLGLFELVHLVVDIFSYMCCRKAKKVEQMKYG